MSKRKHTEEKMVATQEAPAENYNGIFSQLDRMNGKERQAFAKKLSLKEKKAYVEYIRERDSEEVTGVFRCFEPVGGSLVMSAMAFDGESPRSYTFLDGQTYTVPRYIAKRLENEYQGCGTWYPTNSHILDAAGKPIVHTGKKNRRFGFSSLEFQ